MSNSKKQLFFHAGKPITFERAKMVYPPAAKDPSKVFMGIDFGSGDHTVFVSGFYENGVMHITSIRRLGRWYRIRQKIKLAIIYAWRRVKKYLGNIL